MIDRWHQETILFLLTHTRTRKRREKHTNFKYKAKLFHASANKVLRSVLSCKVPNISKANNIISNSNGREPIR